MQQSEGGFRLWYNLTLCHKKEAYPAALSVPAEKGVRDTLLLSHAQLLFLYVRMRVFVRFCVVDSVRVSV